MSEGQLREAFALMKQGNKETAAHLVQDVLREDCDNADAWWLLAHLLNDKAKVVKCLEKVLHLEPEHQAAHKKLGELAPDSPGLFNLPPLVIENWEKEEAFKLDSEDYWEKLDNRKFGLWELLVEEASSIFSPLPAQKTSFEYFMLFPEVSDGRYVWPVRRNYMRGAFLVPFIILIGFGGLALLMPFIPRNADTYEPQLRLAAQYIVALYSEDEASLYAMSCPAFVPSLDRLVSDFDGLDLSAVRVDISQTSFMIHDFTGDTAEISVGGITSIHYQNTVETVHWAEQRLTNSIFLRQIEGIWKVCIETN